MYKVSEKKLETLLCEGTSLLDRLNNTGVITKSEIHHFGNALLEVQTEVHRQSTVIDNGLFRERLQS